MPSWIDLNDATGARLKLANIDVQGVPVLHLFVTNLSYANPKWSRVIREMSFNAAPSRKYLVRRVEPGEKIVASRFHGIFPSARLVDMPRESYMLGVAKTAVKTLEDRSTEVDMRGVTRLGRNQEGLEVFDSLSGRFYETVDGKRVAESDTQKSTLFLRLARAGGVTPQGNDLNAALSEVCGGFVKAMDLGEVQHSEDYDAFRRAVFGLETSAEVDALLSAAIDGALINYVSSQHDVALQAYSPMARLYDYLPPYRGRRRGEGAVPAPLNIAAQRLLGDTTEKVVLFPNAFDGAAFAFLPDGTTIRAYRGQEGVVDLSDFATPKPGVSWLGKYTVASESGANALIFNADPLRTEQGARQDYQDALQCLRSLAPNARAILLLAADEATGSGQVGAESRRFLEALANRFSVEDVFETAPILSQKSGGTKGIRTISLRNAPPVDFSEQQTRLAALCQSGVPVLSSWDAVKAHVDEAIVRIDLKEAESQTIDLQRSAAAEGYQKPYLAFSKLGEARTMSPANLQASSQSYLTRLEAIYGPVDDFLQQQLGMGKKTMAANFSPEQLDGMAVMISRCLVGRSSILSDDTGIGKGRQLAGLATWANKRGEKVVFVTDRSNLFSDLARDLKDIGEWDRFRPLVMNADGEITVEESPGADPTVLAKGEPASAMQDIVTRNLSLDDVQRNIVFLTYSQISGVESSKALWLKNQISDALVIFDEAHIAAGSDSNIALQVVDIAALAKHAQFASATWAKTHDNMHIFQRAFPQSVAVGTLAETMRKGGDSFSEIFSTMLSAEGALIRREHDLSKLEVEMVIDTERKSRNEMVSDKVAEVLGAAAFISGDMQQVFIRTNAESVRLLRGARDARASGISGKLFTASFGAGSVIYQVMKSVQGALNAEHVGDLAVASVAKGMKPVIVSDATGESLLETMIAEFMAANPGSSRPELMKMPTLQDMLRHVIYKRLSTVRVENVTAEDIAEDDQFEQAGTGREVLEALGIDGLDGIGTAAGTELEEQGGAVAQAEPDASAVTEAVGGEVLEIDEGFNEQEIIERRVAAQETQRVNAEGVVDVQAAFAAVAENGNGDAGADVGDGDGADEKRRKRRKRVFRDVLVADMDDLPPQARAIYAAGLKELEEKINSVPAIAVIGFDVITQRLRDAGITIGEISGRKNMLIREPTEAGVALSDAESMWRIVPRAKSKKAVKATIRSFNNGQTEAAILNRSAATGVSMHSSPRFLDQRRRHLIEHQIPEDPVIRVQLLGRVNRFDQLSSPLITSASTGIFGEVRYLMMQNRKLARMSANVRSSRDNAMALKNVIDLFNAVGRQAVQGFLQDNALICRRLGISEFEIAKNPDIVNRLTMNIPMLLVSQQKIVYEELYSRFDEIIVRAELEGENPLRPHEMDVRAATASESLFFGDDSEPDEFMSAFDAPVIAKQITWMQERNPLSFNAVMEGAKASRDRLFAAGYLHVPATLSSPATTAVNGFQNRFVPPQADQPNVQPEMAPGLYKRITDGYFGLTRLSHMATEAETYEISMSSFPAAERTYAKLIWMKDNLRWLVPGTRIFSTLKSDGSDLGAALSSDHTYTIITDVRPPATDSELLDPGKWKITVVTSGDDKSQTYTLRSLLSAVESMTKKGDVAGSLMCHLWGPVLNRGLFCGSQQIMKTTFDMAFRGQQRREATVLSGNMYLAAEWAAATKKGLSTIYTDESGGRHRVVKLAKDIEMINPNRLPIRLADPATIQRFLEPLTASLVVPTSLNLTAEVGLDVMTANNASVHVFDTSFKSAMAFVQNNHHMSRDAICAIEPGGVIALSCSPKDARRIRTALTTGQIAVRKKALGSQSRASDDTAHVVVRSYKTKKDFEKLSEGICSTMRLVTGLAGSRDIFATAGFSAESEKVSKVAVVALDISTPEKAARSVALICQYAGLEIYATTRDLKAYARDTIRSVLSDRRLALRSRQEEMRLVIANATASETRDAQAQNQAQDVTDVTEKMPVISSDGKKSTEVDVGENKDQNLQEENESAGQTATQTMS